MNNRSRLVTAPLKQKHNFYASFVLIPRLKIEFSIVTSVISGARTVCKEEGDFTYRTRATISRCFNSKKDFFALRLPHKKHIKISF